MHFLLLSDYLVVNLKKKRWIFQSHSQEHTVSYTIILRNMCSGLSGIHNILTFSEQTAFVSCLDVCLFFFNPHDASYFWVMHFLQENGSLSQTCMKTDNFRDSIYLSHFINSFSPQTPCWCLFMSMRTFCVCRRMSLLSNVLWLKSLLRMLQWSVKT